MKNKKPYALLTIAISIFGLQTAAHAGQEPNYYECSGKNVKLTLMIGGGGEVGIAAPETSLNLEIGKNAYSFKGQDIKVESTLIGKLNEVTLKTVPDVSTSHATLVIPTVSFNEQPLKFNSRLILTTVASKLDMNNFEGVVNPSKYIKLACEASVIYY